MSNCSDSPASASDENTDFEPIYIIDFPDTDEERSNDGNYAGMDLDGHFYESPYHDKSLTTSKSLFYDTEVQKMDFDSNPFSPAGSIIRTPFAYTPPADLSQFNLSGDNTANLQTPPPHISSDLYALPHSTNKLQQLPHLHNSALSTFHPFIDGNISNLFAPSQIIATGFSPSKESPLIIVQDDTAFRVALNAHPGSALTRKRHFEFVLHDDKSPSPPGKRRRKKARQTAPRAELACEVCRKDKKKCTGPPRCKRCVKRGINCEFPGVQERTRLSSIEMSGEQQSQAELGSSGTVKFTEHATVGEFKLKHDNTDRQINPISSLLEIAVAPTTPTAQSQQQIPGPGHAVSAAVVEKHPNEHECGTAVGCQGVNTSPAVDDGVAVLQQQKELKAFRFRCYFDENLLGIAKSSVLDPVRLGCDFADAATMAELGTMTRGFSDEQIVVAASSSDRTIITNDTDFFALGLQNKRGTIVLRGSLKTEHGTTKAFRSLRRRDKQATILSLFENNMEELERIYESGVCELAELSGQYTENNTLATMSWKCRPPTEIERERWVMKYQTKMEKKNEGEAENTVQDNIRVEPKDELLARQDAMEKQIAPKTHRHILEVNQRIVEEDNNHSDPDNRLKTKANQTTTHRKPDQAEDIDPYAWITKNLDPREYPEIQYDSLEKIRIIGYGSRGTVFKANWKQSIFPVVVKQYVDPSDMLHDVKFFDRLGRHKNIVYFHGVTRNPETNQFEIVQEYASRGTIRDLWGHNIKLPWSEKIRMANDLACGLRHIHQKNFVHRGLNCDNVLVRKDGSVTLTGFSDSGISVNADPGDPPNNLKNNSDVYNLGVLLREIYYDRDASEVDQYEMQHKALIKHRPIMKNEYIQLCKECEYPRLTIDKIVDRLENLKPAEDGCQFNWEQLDDICIDREIDKKTGLEINTELEELNVNIIPNSEIRFIERHFHRGGSAAIDRAIWGENPVTVKLQVRYPADIIREVKILTMVGNHHNIVQLHGVTRDSKLNSYTVMPWTKSNLRDYVRCREYPKKSWHSKLAIALGIAKGLRYLHQHHIIHCDLNSGHVLIDQDGTARLTDFRLSQTFEEAQRPGSRVKIQGRFGYIAPELFEKPLLPFDYVHDIFAYGVLCWEIASSKSPHSDTKFLRQERLSPYIGLAPRICPKYRDLYIRCGSKDPKSRPGLEEIIGEMQRLLLKEL